MSGPVVGGEHTIGVPDRQSRVAAMTVVAPEVRASNMRVFLCDHCTAVLNDVRVTVLTNSE